MNSHFSPSTGYESKNFYIVFFLTWLKALRIVGFQSVFIRARQIGTELPKKAETKGQIFSDSPKLGEKVILHLPHLVAS